MSLGGGGGGARGRRNPRLLRMREFPSFRYYISTDQGEAAPMNINPGLKVGYVPFTLGSDPNQCGVAGRTVIVHASSGTRVGCGILA